MIEEKLHATYSASGSERWLKCPGSIKLTEKAPPQVDNDYSKEGTQAHACLEYMLKNRANPQAARKFLLKNNPSEMVGNVDYVFGEIMDMLEDYSGADLLCETKVNFSFIEKDQFGTLDVSIVQMFGTLTVIDFKYGAGIAVDVEDNSQMIYYAVCIAEEYGWDFEKVQLVIMQPRAEHSGGPIRRQVMSIEKLKEWVDVFKKGVAETKNPNAKFVHGDHCRWCPAKTICPEISKKSLAQARIVFDEIDGNVALPVIKSNEVIANLGNILSAAEKIDLWLTEVRAHAVHVLNKGHKVDGWKLVEKRGTRKWINPEKATQEAKQKWGNKCLTTPELLSPAQLEKKFSKTINESWINKRVTNVSSGLTLVPESDKRQAVNPAEEVFDEIEQPKKLKQSRKEKRK
jgi:hypothetical protein